MNRWTRAGRGALQPEIVLDRLRAAALADMPDPVGVRLGAFRLILRAAEIAERLHWRLEIADSAKRASEAEWAAARAWAEHLGWSEAAGEEWATLYPRDKREVELAWTTARAGAI